MLKLAPLPLPLPYTLHVQYHYYLGHIAKDVINSMHEYFTNWQNVRQFASVLTARVTVRVVLSDLGP